ncbi:hypothetical protein R1sor_001029 [Riccia sorocarpa]|uniref:Uncharacterized protein n=1 Tax=Riccia sorocarpa TaxID=122646 RepID=A0ABD3GX87_9MARC
MASAGGCQCRFDCVEGDWCEGGVRGSSPPVSTAEQSDGGGYNRGGRSPLLSRDVNLVPIQSVMGVAARIPDKLPATKGMNNENIPSPNLAVGSPPQG